MELSPLSPSSSSLSSLLEFEVLWAQMVDDSDCRLSRDAVLRLHRLLLRNDYYYSCSCSDSRFSNADVPLLSNRHSANRSLNNLKRFFFSYDVEIYIIELKDL